MRISIYSLILVLIISACSPNPYKATEKTYDRTLNKLKETISSKESIELALMNNYKITIDTLFTNRLHNVKDSISRTGLTILKNGVNTEWISTVNFNLRKPNFIIIHHTAQDSIQQTIKTFTLERTQVSSHYVIGDNGRVIQMLNDYLRAWHGGSGSWGKITDINSTSIGIELDNNGSEPFSDAQINSLLALLSKLKKDYNIPTQNIIGHADIAPSRKRDPSAFFPWKTLAENGFGIWSDEVLEQAPVDFNVEQALRIIGYDTKNISAAVTAFKLHYVQSDVNDVIDDYTKNVLYSIYKKS